MLREFKNYLIKKFLFNVFDIKFILLMIYCY